MCGLVEAAVAWRRVPESSHKACETLHESDKSHKFVEIYIFCEKHMLGYYEQKKRYFFPFSRLS